MAVPVSCRFGANSCSTIVVDKAYNLFDRLRSIFACSCASDAFYDVYSY